MKKAAVIAGLFVALFLGSMVTAQAGIRYSFGFGIGVGPAIPYGYYYPAYPPILLGLLRLSLLQPLLLRLLSLLSILRSTPILWQRQIPFLRERHAETAGFVLTADPMEDPAQGVDKNKFCRLPGSHLWRCRGERGCPLMLMFET